MITDKGLKTFICLVTGRLLSAVSVGGCGVLGVEHLAEPDTGDTDSDADSDTDVDAFITVDDSQI